MGRGRAKAKQTRVARKLKYTSPETDFASLERELSGRRSTSESPYDHDPYAEKYADDHESYK